MINVHIKQIIFDLHTEFLNRISEFATFFSKLAAKSLLFSFKLIKLSIIIASKYFFNLLLDLNIVKHAFS